jgi:hypothetical protein
LAAFEALEEEEAAPPALSGSVVVRLETRDPDVSIIVLEPGTGDSE